MSITEIAGVDETETRIQHLLARAREVTRTNAIETALPASNFAGSQGLPRTEITESTHFGVVEVASRRVFHQFISKYAIADPEFVNVWNLLDILLICGDQEQCDSSLVWWLIEELLDSQSLEGCRDVFDYLESRRERLIAKHFVKKKDLVILRSCNELLRRLSRAEDAVFCGRVFTFLFQSFPLGDRSSVNPKGEFNVENVTTFDETPATNEGDVDMQTQEPETNNDAEELQTNKTFDADSLYPTFWKLQKAFSNPPTVFDRANLDEFKSALEITLAKFKEVPKVKQASVVNTSRKRKLDEGQDQEFASTFNPKYLTSRDLFRLELSDLAFQRHILVQALILLDFLLSLTEKAKRNQANRTTQKSLQYNFTLSDQDTEWVQSMKIALAQYLQEPPDGKMYYRMVDTVLARDKNWVRWKEENCPEISRHAVSTEHFVKAKDGMKKVCTSQRLRPTPMGSLDLGFLTEPEHSQIRGVDALTLPARRTLPTPDALVKKVKEGELDMDFATEEEKPALLAAKASNTWKTLRIAARTKLSFFDKVNDGKNLEYLQCDGSDPSPKNEDVAAADGGEGPKASSDDERQ